MHTSTTTADDAAFLEQCRAEVRAALRCGAIPVELWRYRAGGPLILTVLRGSRRLTCTIPDELEQRVREWMDRRTKNLPMNRIWPMNRWTGD